MSPDSRTSRLCTDFRRIHRMCTGKATNMFFFRQGVGRLDSPHELSISKLAQNKESDARILYPRWTWAARWSDTSQQFQRNLLLEKNLPCITPTRWVLYEEHGWIFLLTCSQASGPSDQTTMHNIHCISTTSRRYKTSTIRWIWKAWKGFGVVERFEAQFEITKWCILDFCWIQKNGHCDAMYQRCQDAAF